MKRIVEFKPAKNKDRIEIVFDDGTSLATVKSMIKKAGLEINMPADVEKLERLVGEDDFNRCYEAALNFLEYRPRSESELKNHLLFKRRFSDNCVVRTLEKLNTAGLLDDKAFAESWVKDRIANKPRSCRMIRRELFRKGVNSDIINNAVAGVSDEESAFKAGMRKANTLKKYEYSVFVKRLTGFLARRGYGSGVVNSAVTRVWDNVR